MIDFTVVIKLTQKGKTMTLQSTSVLYTDHIRRTPLSEMQASLELMLSELGFGRHDRENLTSTIYAIFRDVASEVQAVRMVSELLSPQLNILEMKLAGRADTLLAQIGSYVRGQEVLDFGCGDGRVGAGLARQIHSAVPLPVTEPELRKVVLYDLDDRRVEEARSLPFESDWDKLPLHFHDRAAHLAFALVVLHHCDDPETELERLRHITRRVVIIESVVTETMTYGCQAVVDWLYNRGMHPGEAIPVPGNFKSVEAWRETFARHGFRVTHEEDLGIDLPIVPEHHHLFVLDQ